MEQLHLVVLRKALDLYELALFELLFAPIQLIYPPVDDIDWIGRRQISPSGSGSLPALGGPSLVPMLLVGGSMVLLLVAGGLVVMARLRP